MNTMSTTKEVLGRVFLWHDVLERWQCYVNGGTLVIEERQHSLNPHKRHMAFLGFTRGADDIVLRVGYVPTEEDAIRALQSTLSKIAELRSEHGVHEQPKREPGLSALPDDGNDRGTPVLKVSECPRCVVGIVTTWPNGKQSCSTCVGVE